MLKIYGDLLSGNCLKVKYTAVYLDIPYAWMGVDILAGESRGAEYLAEGSPLPRTVRAMSQ